VGGQVALTIRFSDGEEWRGSTHTAQLCEGIFGAAFYTRDSETHARTWLTKLLARRGPAEADLAAHMFLAPVEYGLIVVDYLSSTVYSDQGYYRPTHAFRIPNCYQCEYHGGCCPTDARFDALQAAGLLYGGKRSESLEDAQIDTSTFATFLAEDGQIDRDAFDWIRSLFEISFEEATIWRAWIGRRSDRIRREG
jgi:hypothetical protein